ncbi:MAG TPA: hypothetical protein EYH04_04300 [Archaeoglobus profundus]|nr:hypothetical protein [Archaeoglobus profundus]
MIKLTEKQTFLLLYVVATITAMALMLYVPKVTDDFLLIALVVFSIPMAITIIGSIIILIKFKYIKLNFKI